MVVLCIFLKRDKGTHLVNYCWASEFVVAFFSCVKVKRSAWPINKKSPNIAAGAFKALGIKFL